MSLKSVVSSKAAIALYGLVAGVFIYHLFVNSLVEEWLSNNVLNVQPSELSQDSSEQKPLYWVAPMDDNYRRNKPGKSPMGMDLIPVYSTSSQQINSEEQGVVVINPSVVNNLGVRTQKVQRGKLNKQINTVGYITFNEDKLVHIHPRIAGWIEKLYVKAAGDFVKKGQPLYELYSPELVNAQEEYLLTLTAKDTSLIEAAENRLKSLHIAQAVIDDIKLNRKVKQHVTFHAPQKGIVKDLSIREGFYVELGTKLFSIGDISEVWVEAEVFERQVRQIHVGDEVIMTLDYLPSQVWRGEVDYIHPILDAKTRTVKARLRFKNLDFDLKPNMFAQVTIYDASAEETLFIPKEALIRLAKQNKVVLALGEGRFKSVSVNVASEDKHNIEITSGLKEGDNIVVSAQFLIDSESSKTSDFIRMSAMPEETKSTEELSHQARVMGMVNSVNLQGSKVNVSREAIEKWGRPPATMDFSVLSSTLLHNLKIGQTIDFTFEIVDDEFIITKLHPHSHTSVQQRGDQ